MGKGYMQKAMREDIVCMHLPLKTCITAGIFAQNYSTEGSQPKNKG